MHPKTDDQTTGEVPRRRRVRVEDPASGLSREQRLQLLNAAQMDTVAAHGGVTLRGLKADKVRLLSDNFSLIEGALNTVELERGSKRRKKDPAFAAANP